MATMSQPTINTYISDMLALEQHIETPLKNQVADGDLQNSPVALRVVTQSYNAVQTRIAALEARLEAVGGHAGAPVKNAVSSIAGIAAAAIDKVRKTEVSKNLRDDYTALALSAAGYTMLHTTALGLGDNTTAALAQRHLTSVASEVIKIGKALPVVVLTELADMGVSVAPSVAATAEKDANDAWNSGSSESM